MEKPLQEPETKALCSGPGHMLPCFIITKATGMGFGTFPGETPWGPMEPFCLSLLLVRFVPLWPHMHAGVIMKAVNAAERIGTWKHGRSSEASSRGT